MTNTFGPPPRIDLSPARWIWLPSQRTLPNTFVLFRHEVSLPEQPVRAQGFLCADSRYRLTVNGRRVQWGPAPSDPRQMEADPLDLLPFLRAGDNVIGAEVLYYGFGEGTWPGGKPGFIFNLQIELPNGETVSLVSDSSWLVCLDRAHRPGQFKRWYLRALQEEYDARLAPQGWDNISFRPDGRWLPAMELDCSAANPPICSSYPDYLNDAYQRKREGAESMAGIKVGLYARQIPLLREIPVPVVRLAESGRVKWNRDPLDWFEFRTPGSLELTRQSTAEERGENAWELPASVGDAGVYATLELPEQMVGWPFFSIEAPAGTVVELICQESHDPSHTGWLDTHYFTWSRSICREGLNQFEAFDYESLRWIQLHVHHATRPVTISAVGVRRRLFPWPHDAHMRTTEPPLQRLLDASLNTLCNCAQETCVDGMGRERQQTSGDVGHQLKAIRYAFGETRLPARFLRTYSSSQTQDGYFLDVWPAVDSLARISQKLVGATFWGPILDHGVQLVFDCWDHYLETGDLEAVREPYPRLVRFAAYLAHLRRADGLLPVEDLGLPYVWMDHNAYLQQRHKECAFNLYSAAMFEYALAPLQYAFGENEEAVRSERTGREILGAATRSFWDPGLGLFVNNRPWLAKESGPRLCDRSLANAILFDQCPEGNRTALTTALVECPPEMGLSFPANSGWRLHALAQLGQGTAILQDLRKRWANLDSVILNNTIQESWRARPDSSDQWSHCAVVPTYVVFMDVAGIRPLKPGFARVQIRPQLGDLESLDLVAQTVRGPIGFSAKKQGSEHWITIGLPTGCPGELLLPAGSHPALAPLPSSPESGLVRFLLEAGTRVAFSVRSIE